MRAFTVNFFGFSQRDNKTNDDNDVRCVHPPSAVLVPLWPTLQNGPGHNFTFTVGHSRRQPPKYHGPRSF